MEKRKRIAALLMLVVYLAAFTFSYTHRHEAVVNITEECEDCVHHLPHPGHLTALGGGISDCVLCHFIGLPFIVSLLTVVAAVTLECYRVSSAPRTELQEQHLRLRQSRAPPVVCLP